LPIFFPRIFIFGAFLCAQTFPEFLFSARTRPTIRAPTSNYSRRGLPLGLRGAFFGRAQTFPRIFIFGAPTHLKETHVSFVKYLLTVNKITIIYYHIWSYTLVGESSWRGQPQGCQMKAYDSKQREW